MSFEGWLHRKAEENAHNEILAFLLMILGVNLLMGGLLTTLIIFGELTVLLHPYRLPPSFSVYSSFILSVVGFAVLFAGFILVLYYNRKRLWFVNEIEKSAIRRKIAPKTAIEILQEYAGKQKKRET
ncbi:MAG: hypothetical protein OEW71_01995 [Candidatus Bathyarchaeota archaeon]|nr:hypothetical protein [Candidatus Bathyarchaeota archaeon]